MFLLILGKAGGGLGAGGREKHGCEKHPLAASFTPCTRDRTGNQASVLTGN